MHKNTKNHEGKRPLGKPKYKFKDIVKIEVKYNEGQNTTKFIS